MTRSRATLPSLITGGFIGIVVLLSAIGLVCGGVASVGQDTIRKSAMANAHEYAAESGLQILGATCTSTDSDMDGYVSCSITLEDGATHPLECVFDRPIWLPAIWLYGQPSGCKAVVFAPIGVNQPQ